MKVAFVGKGGAGKTTLAAFFTDYLVSQGKHVLALDADINIHFARNFGIQPVSEKALSYPANKQAIREHLRGANNQISDAKFFVKTTPPGQGSNLLKISPTDPFIANHTQNLAENFFAAYVGTYETEEIGISCYHTNLGIAENIVSHLLTGKNHWLITDMVAGTDAFSGSLHLLFDAIFLVVEPTPEGVGVFQQYKHLAEAAGIWEHVWVVGNKIQDEVDQNYLKENIGEKLVGFFNSKKQIGHMRQQGQKLTLDQFGHQDVFQALQNTAENSVWDRQKQLHKLHALHRIHATEDYIISSCGDVSVQIDADFIFPNHE
jgi:CO dehydrogenase maturation factor